MDVIARPSATSGPPAALVEMMSKLSRLLATAGAAALLAPAAASAAAPWSPPVAIPGAGNGSAAVTPVGHPVAIDPASRNDPPGPPSQLVRLDPTSGAPLSATGLALAGAFVTSYARDAIAVAGSSLGPSGTVDDQSRVRVGTTSAAGGTPTLHTLSGTAGQNVSALVGNARGDVALTTRGLRSRLVYLRRHGTTTFSRILTISVSSNARDITVALGTEGDVLVVWEDQHKVFARHRGTRGTWGAVHVLGPGVQSHLQAAVDPTGRLLVAWASQRVGEGDAATSPDVHFITAAPGHGFGTLRTVQTQTTGTGNVAVAAPAVRLVVTGRSRALLAWTGFDGTRFSVRASTLSAGHVGAAQSLSPADTDSVLGDVATAPATGDADGPTVVLWRAGVHGTDPAATGTTARVFAAVRPAGAAGFGAPEAVSQAGDDVTQAPTALLVPGTARPLALFGRSGAAQSAIRAPIVA